MEYKKIKELYDLLKSFYDFIPYNEDDEELYDNIDNVLNFISKEYFEISNEWRIKEA